MNDEETKAPVWVSLCVICGLSAVFWGGLGILVSLLR